MNYAKYIECVRSENAVWGGKHIKLMLINPIYRMVIYYWRCKYLEGKKILYPIYMIHRFYYHHICLKNGCDIPSHATIGKGFKIIHSWGIVIASRAIIGENCTILSGTLVGGTKTGNPVIGNNVYIGAHSLIIGGITIGDGAVIGAGSIVTHDVPANAVVHGEASRITRIKDRTEK